MVAPFNHMTMVHSKFLCVNLVAGKPIAYTPHHFWAILAGTWHGRINDTYKLVGLRMMAGENSSLMLQGHVRMMLLPI